jgi:hypothetical protein
MRRRAAVLCLGRGRGTARPSALIDKKHNQSRRRERPHRVGEYDFAKLWRQRRRAVYIDGAGCAEWAVTVADRRLRWRVWVRRTDAAMGAQFKPGPSGSTDGGDCGLADIQRKQETLQSERIGEDAPQHAPPSPLRSSRHNATHPIRIVAKLGEYSGGKQLQFE